MNSFTYPCRSKDKLSARIITGRRFNRSTDVSLTVHADSHRIGWRMTQEQLAEFIQRLEQLQCSDD